MSAAPAAAATATLTGGCLCGRVRYAVEDDFRYAGYCHCPDCRRFSGAAASAMAGVPAAAFRLVAGAEVLREYVKSAATVLAFCGECGSSLFAAKPLKGMIHLRLGSLDAGADASPGLRPRFHSYVASKAAWETIADDLPQYPAGRS